MKKEVRLLREKAINSLVLSIDHFNRTCDRGRTEAVIILLDHSFKMLLKAAILHRLGRIRRDREKQTIGFHTCVQRGLSLKFLTEEQVVTLQTIKGLRNAVQHYLADISEHQLYLYSTAGVTLFHDVHDDVFNKNLVLELPERVLPISTTVPKDLLTLFDKEVEEIRELLTPGTRKKMDAVSKTRSLAVLEGAVNGNYEQPSDRELQKVCKRLADGEAWSSVFPGVASINIIPEVDGPTLRLCLTKNEGIPVRFLKEGEGTDAALAVRRVNELDFYSLGAAQLAKKVGLTQPKSRAVVDHIGLRKDADCFKEIKIGSSTFARYSPQAIDRIKQTLATESIEDIWFSYRAKKRALKSSNLPKVS